MKSIARSLLFFAVLTATAVPAFGQKERADEVQRLRRATQVFNEIMKTPDKGIPADLLDKAACISIVPGLKKGGLGVGGRYGKGIIMCRNGNRQWSAPAFMSVKGGSFGLQIGFEQIDLVMLIMNRAGIEKLLGDKFTIGADASAAAGPVGRNTSAETNIRLDAQILTYSRAKGLFAGLTLNGAVVEQDKDDNRDFYRKPIEARAILLEQAVPMPAEGKPLAAALSRESPKEK